MYSNIDVYQNCISKKGLNWVIIWGLLHFFFWKKKLWTLFVIPNKRLLKGVGGVSSVGARVAWVALDAWGGGWRCQKKHTKRRESKCWRGSQNQRVILYRKHCVFYRIWFTFTNQIQQALQLLLWFLIYFVLLLSKRNQPVCDAFLDLFSSFFKLWLSF